MIRSPKMKYRFRFFSEKRLRILMCILLSVSKGFSQSSDIALIPCPRQIEALPGQFSWDRPISLQREGDIYMDDTLFRTLVGLPLNIRPDGNVILLRMIPQEAMPPEGYTLTIHPDNIRIEASSMQGLLWGISTLRQTIHCTASGGCVSKGITVRDEPVFPYRGMHLDVVRHFFSVSFIKKYIDLLFRYKFNTFHWHLTDDQGWRIQIQRYPKLTASGAWRNGSQIGPYADMAFDTLRYGGFYTREEIREVVAYAAERGITVIPEIEMPGHARAALAAYPELSCSGGPFEVAQGWGVFEEVFCTQDTTLFFLEHVLAEVMELFPSQWIHIGGDECPKVQWKKCLRCQQRISAEGLKDEHELQSWFIRRIERFVNSKGRRIIGWDEILEGGLAPNAAVMSWRGMEGGIAAATAGHDVVMTPVSHCYFDYYQGLPELEPHAIGGFTPLLKVYGFDPIPPQLPESARQFIKGAQGNVWSEYLTTTDHVEYMVLPRMAALAEVLWHYPIERDTAGFLRRLAHEMPRLHQAGYHPSYSHYQVNLETLPGSRPGSMRIVGQSTLSDNPFTLTWTTPQGMAVDTVKGWFELDHSATVTAGMMPADPKVDFPITCKTFHFNKATARTVKVVPEPHPSYSSGGAFSLVNGISGDTRRRDNAWLGWLTDVTITLDLDQKMPFDSLSLSAWSEPGSWIYFPQEIQFLTSADGEKYRSLHSLRVSEDEWHNTKPGKRFFTARKKTKARYLKIIVRSIGTIPDGMPGAGHPAWLFLDEITIH